NVSNLAIDLSNTKTFEGLILIDNVDAYSSGNTAIQINNYNINTSIYIKDSYLSKGNVIGASLQIQIPSSNNVSSLKLENLRINNIRTIGTGNWIIAYPNALIEKNFTNITFMNTNFNYEITTYQFKDNWGNSNIESIQIIGFFHSSKNNFVGTHNSLPSVINVTSHIKFKNINATLYPYPIPLFLGSSCPESRCYNVVYSNDNFEFDISDWGVSPPMSSNFSVGTKLPITNCTDLQAINDSLSADYILTNNIDCSDTINWNAGEGFLPMGDYPNYFDGTLDGQGYNITNLYLNPSIYVATGLFGEIGSGEVRNLGLINVSVSQFYGAVAGAVAGYIENGLIDNVFVTGLVNTNGGGETGGFVGLVDLNASVSNSYSTAYVVADSYAGGFVGYTYGSINNSYATGNVYAISDSAGGLVGFADSGSSIKNSYATGDVDSVFYAGGFVGYALSSLIENSYATGTITSTDDNGGFIGYSQGNSIIRNSSATGDVYGNNENGGFAGFLSANDLVQNSYATGNVYGATNNGGFVGRNYGNIENSYSTGNVNATGSQNGGFVGSIWSGLINNSYATGNVIGNSGTAGFVGYGETSEISNSYSIGAVSGGVMFKNAFAGLLIGTCTNNFFDNETSIVTTDSCATGKTTLQMQTQSTFTDAGWDFTTIWGINDNQYPVLRVFGFTEDVIPPVEVEDVTDTAIYKTMETSGKGLARLLELLAIPLFIFLITLSIIVAVAMIIKAFSEIIKGYVNRK
ncbi:MAG: hypothetical protein MUO21_11960, partial [Nitrososphaeraceae archaeon]|nr:hypothetical protein [Nitrososphaeraceae archaeon]